jgi:hypothetical protein
MPSFLYRMPAGIPGAVNRHFHSTIETQIIMPANPPGAYGVPVVIDATALQIRPLLTTADTATSVYGFLVRPFPATGTGIDGLGTATPGTSGTCNILVRGYMSVQLNGATAAKKNGAVFVRVAAAATGKPIGGVEAASDTTNTITIPNCRFMGPADATGNVEIAFNI